MRRDGNRVRRRCGGDRNDCRLFFDAGHIYETPAVVDLLEAGGLLVKDDMTPNRPGPDPVRAFLFEHPQLVAVEILTTPKTAAIVAAKRSANP